MWQNLFWLPEFSRKFISKSILSIAPEKWNKLSKIFPQKYQTNNFADKLYKGADVFPSSSFNLFYRDFHLSNSRNPESIVFGGSEPNTIFSSGEIKNDNLDLIQKMMVFDQMFYLPDDILTKVDRAAMSMSLETRIPLLDHKIIEFSWSLPQSIKYRNGTTKWPLHQILYQYVPKKLVNRPKSGFSIPLSDWLRGSLRDWAEDLLDYNRIKDEGVFKHSKNKPSMARAYVWQKKLGSVAVEYFNVSSMVSEK